MNVLLAKLKNNSFSFTSSDDDTHGYFKVKNMIISLEKTMEHR